MDHYYNSQSYTEWADETGYYGTESGEPDARDEEGRLLDTRKVAELHNAFTPEDFDLFLSQWKPPRLVASQRDWAFASNFVFPDIPRVVLLKRLDIFERMVPRTHQASMDPVQSLKIRCNMRVVFHKMVLLCLVSR